MSGNIQETSKKYQQKKFPSEDSMKKIYAIEFIYPHHEPIIFMYHSEDQIQALQEAECHTSDTFLHFGNITLLIPKPATLRRYDKEKRKYETFVAPTVISNGFLAYVREDTFHKQRCKTEWKSEKEAYCTIYGDSHEVKFL